MFWDCDQAQKWWFDLRRIAISLYCSCVAWHLEVVLMLTNFVSWSLCRKKKGRPAIRRLFFGNAVQEMNYAVPKASSVFLAKICLTAKKRAQLCGCLLSYVRHLAAVVLYELPIPRPYHHVATFPLREAMEKLGFVICCKGGALVFC